MSEQVQLKNLDQLAAQTAQEIVEQGISAHGGQRKEAAEAVDNLVTKALGVLQENGIYAGVLFLCSRTREQDKRISGKVQEQLRVLLKSLSFQLNPPDNPNAQEQLEFYADHVCDDLDKLFLIKELYEQTLIYARYGAKAAKESAELQASSS